ncbi:hypothetical protein [Aneurinibacillus migulanus]|nr:hypothetical protein [Aneurinibacillus migulanus]
MQIQYINEILDIPELKIHQILPMNTDEIHIGVPLYRHQVNEKEAVFTI